MPVEARRVLGVESLLLDTAGLDRLNYGSLGAHEAQHISAIITAMADRSQET